MKHLKTYENKNELYWISYVYYHFEIHPNRESAENSIINYVNQEIENGNQGYDEEDCEDLVLTFDEATSYFRDVEDTDKDVIGIGQAEQFTKPVELWDEVNKLNQVKKYNL